MNRTERKPDSAYRTIHLHIFVVSDAMLHYSPILKQAALSPSIGDHRYLNNRGDGTDIPMDWFSPAVFVWFDDGWFGSMVADWFVRQTRKGVR
jgi:hypothetical protein